MVIHTFLNNSTFIRKDQSILESELTVIAYEFKVMKKWHLPFVLLKQLFFLIRISSKATVFINQFSGYHSFLPCLIARISGKKSLIIAGGTDCVKFPEIGYGNFYRPFLRWFTAQSYRLCTAISPKHLSLWFCQYDYDNKEPSQQGIKAFVPSLSNRVVTINNGYDITFWKNLNLTRTPGSFVTVSGGFEYDFQVQLKGIDLILETAPAFPDCIFTIVGVPEWKKLNIQSDNVRVLPAVQNNQLPEIYNTNEYYLQLSMAEGFPNALCEAMLCGCTPIVSSVFSMPEIVGENGYILQKRDKEDLKKLIGNIIQNGPNPADESRDLIAQRFTIENRKEKLLHLVKSLM